MKKLLEKDKRLRVTIKKIETLTFVLKTIYKNDSFSTFTRWNAYSKLKQLLTKKSTNMLSNRCVYSYNKKRFNRTTTFSRHIFLKLIRSGQIHGIQKSSW